METHYQFTPIPPRRCWIVWGEDLNEDGPDEYEVIGLATRITRESEEARLLDEDVHLVIMPITGAVDVGTVDVGHNRPSPDDPVVYWSKAEAEARVAKNMAKWRPIWAAKEAALAAVNG